MSMSNASENDALKWMLKGIDPSWRASANEYIALHTSDPGEGGSAVTNEADYTGYGRQTAVKATFWSDGGAVFSNAALLQFPACSGGTNSITHFSVVTTASGAGQILVSGPLSGTLNVSTGIQPQFAAGELTVAAD